MRTHINKGRHQWLVTNSLAFPSLAYAGFQNANSLVILGFQTFNAEHVLPTVDSYASA